MVRDQDVGIVRLRAFGTYDFRVTKVPRFLEEVARHRRSFPPGGVHRCHAVADRQRVQRRAGHEQSPCARHREPVRRAWDAFLPLINPVLNAKYGLEMESFVFENVSVPPEVEQARLLCCPKYRDDGLQRVYYPGDFRADRR